MFLTRLLRPKRTAGEVNSILVVSTTALGDTLWATPAITNIRASFPHAKIAVLTSSIGMQVLAHRPEIDQLIHLREPLSWRFFSLVRALRRGNFDVALLLHSSQRLTLPLLTLSGIPKIIGTSGKNKGLDDLLTDPLPPQREHEIERRARITQTLGIKTDVETLSYFVQPQERAEAEQILGEKKRPRIAFHLGARDEFRRFPKRSFLALAALLREQYELFLTGTAQEEPLLQEIASQLPEAKILNQPFRTFAALLEQMDLIVSTDTGPLHLACALNRPVVALFASSDPLLFGPHKAPKAKVIEKPATCTPCIMRRCKEPFCYLQISPREVYQTILSFGIPFPR